MSDVLGSKKLKILTYILGIVSKNLLASLFSKFMDKNCSGFEG